ncbi:concanavalin A-like lectin/glucanase domain-containing protein [Aspergillus novoparasiticus]|uniref:endo-1,3(4)-beta-glucanase n=1 Tax=Aspergillus novoparasiticus TaxID=986946 RepID=A0A5N6F7F5_9EURO|nr:concanavalin A-like lectin/glucanase domain-containing protein [Aspergillus novoparasiticus]
MTEKAYHTPADDFSRYGGATANLPKLEVNDLQHAGPPPGPGAKYTPPQPGPAQPWYNPRGWSLRTKLIAGVVGVAVVVAVIVGAVEGTKANRYPDYTKLNYQLVDTYSGTNFLDRFDYYHGEDPTEGFVQYVDQTAANALNLTYATDSSVVLRVDTSNKNAVKGRQSVRLESKTGYDNGLFVFDILHTPYGCGTWPALWLTDTYNWPDNGEIDVLETTNNAPEGNAVTLHTTRGCNMNVRRKQTGDTVYTTCDNSTNGNAGCGVQGSPDSYGEPFNNNGGGVYALELRDAGIRAWMFPRDSIPDDITNSSSSPDPSTWGTALADFPNTDCHIPSHFRNQSIIANIDLCGTLGAQKQFYTEQSHCPGSCNSFVATNPSAFTEAYWEFKSFKVYQAQ